MSSGEEKALGGGAAEHLRRLAEQLNGMVDQCLADAGEEPVHRVRTGSRRVEAMVETLMRTGGQSSTADGAQLAAAGDKWLRQLKKVRRAAGDVRDLDVHREIVAKAWMAAAEDSRDTSDGKASSAADAKSPITVQAAKLDHWLTHVRHKRAANLTAELKKRQSRLVHCEQAFLSTLGEATQGKGTARGSSPKRSLAVLAIEDFLRLVDHMPVLNAENLHDFRKGAKKARYVTEAGGDDPQALAVGKAIKRVQDDIGAWHDWLVLGEEAREALGKAGAELQGEIEAETARLFDKAMRTSERLRHRMLGEWLAGKEASRQRGPQRKGPATASLREPEHGRKTGAR